MGKDGLHVSSFNRFVRRADAIVRPFDIGQ